MEEVLGQLRHVKNNLEHDVLDLEIPNLGVLAFGLT